jgi:hypothetical protein
MKIKCVDPILLGQALSWWRRVAKVCHFVKIDHPLRSEWSSLDSFFDLLYLVTLLCFLLWLYRVWLGDVNKGGFVRTYLGRKVIESMEWMISIYSTVQEDQVIFI